MPNNTHDPNPDIESRPFKILIQDPDGQPYAYLEWSPELGGGIRVGNLSGSCTEHEKRAFEEAARLMGEPWRLQHALALTILERAFAHVVRVDL
jgi:hypothetical protein